MTNSEKINDAFAQVYSLVPYIPETINGWDSVSEGSDKISRNILLLRQYLRTLSNTGSQTVDGIGKKTE